MYFRLLVYAEHFSFAISAMGVDHIDTYSPGAVVNFQRSGGSIIVPAKILGPAERGADHWSITHECSGIVVTHDCAPKAQMSVLLCKEKVAHKACLSVKHGECHARSAKFFLLVTTRTLVSALLRRFHNNSITGSFKLLMHSGYGILELSFIFTYLYPFVPILSWGDGLPCFSVAP